MLALELAQPSEESGEDRTKSKERAKKTYAQGVNVTRIGVGKYVNPDVFVRYAQGLGTSAERDISVEWRLNKILLLKGQTLQRRITSSPSLSTAESEYNMDLRARFDF